MRQVTLLLTLFIFSSFGPQLFAQMMPDKYNELNTKISMVSFDEIFKILDKAIKKNPNDPWYYWIKASVYDIKGEDDKVLENYEKALALDANFSPGHGSLARFMRYNYEEDMSKMNIALTHINIAIQLDPEEDYYRIDRGYIYLALKKFDLAEAEADRALSLPQFGLMEAEQLKINTLYEAGKKDELTAFVKKYDLSDEGPMLGTKFATLLASIYEEIGDKEKACNLYNGIAQPYIMMDEKLPENITAKLKKCP